MIVNFYELIFDSIIELLNYFMAHLRQSLRWCFRMERSKVAPFWNLYRKKQLLNVEMGFSNNRPL